MVHVTRRARLGLAEAEMDLGSLRCTQATFKLHTWKNRTSIYLNGRFFAESSVDSGPRIPFDGGIVSY